MNPCCVCMLVHSYNTERVPRSRGRRGRGYWLPYREAARAERTSSAARETGRSRKRWEWAASRPLISRCTSSSTHCNATGFSSAAAAEDWSGRGLRGRERGRSGRCRGRRRGHSSLAPPAPRSPLRREASTRKGSIGEEGGEEAEPSPGATSGLKKHRNILIPTRLFFYFYPSFFLFVGSRFIFTEIEIRFLHLFSRNPVFTWNWPVFIPFFIPFLIYIRYV